MIVKLKVANSQENEIKNIKKQLEIYAELKFIAQEFFTVDQKFLIRNWRNRIRDPFAELIWESSYHYRTQRGLSWD